MRKIYVHEGYEVVELSTSADIVQYSFIVQESLSPLNLELCQFCYVFDVRTTKYTLLFFSKDFINTEEKCRKILYPGRSVMYTLHLDLPRDTERLKMNSGHLTLSSDRVAKIDIRRGFYVNIIYNLIHYICKRNKDNLKVLKWLIKFNAVEKTLFHNLPCSIINYFLECMHSELDDSEFVMESLRKLDIYKWLYNVHSFKPERFKNYLYQVHRNARQPKCICIRNGIFIDFCISLSSSQITRNVLKLKSGPTFSEILFYYYVDKIYEIRVEYPSKIITFMSRQRGTLLLQVFWIYIIKSKNQQEEIIEFLRLIWRSVPDSFLCSREIQEAFEDEFSYEEIIDICNIYSKAIDELREVVTPRLLQHYCRTTIRRIMSQNGHWLPEGIKKLLLPRHLESYLNLEE